MEETERNGNHFGIFRCAAHKDEMKEVLCMAVVCCDKFRLGIARMPAVDSRRKPPVDRGPWPRTPTAGLLGNYKVDLSGLRAKPLLAWLGSIGLSSASLAAWSQVTAALSATCRHNMPFQHDIDSQITTDKTGMTYISKKCYSN